MTLAELSDALMSRGLIEESKPLTIEPGTAENSSPWYVQVMLGVCAWVAGFLLLVFVVMAVLSGSRGDTIWSVTLMLGIMACGGAGLLYSAVGASSAFGGQFALAMSIAGQTGVSIGLGGVSKDARVTLWGMLLLELALVAAIRNRLHRVLVTAFAVVAWGLAVHASFFGDLPGIKIFGRNEDAVFDSSALSIVYWILVWAPIAYAAFWLVKNEAHWMAAGRDAWFRPLTDGVVAALCFAPLATHPATFWASLGLGPAHLLTESMQSVTALWPLLAMFLAILALALAFALRNRPLMGLAIVFGLLEIGCFYYVLGATLLLKSIIMLVLGVVLLGVAHCLAKEPAA